LLAEIPWLELIADIERLIAVAERIEIDAQVENRPVAVPIVAPVVAAVAAPLAIPPAAVVTRPAAAVLHLLLLLLIDLLLAVIATLPVPVIAVAAPVAAVTVPTLAGLIDLLCLASSEAAAVPVAALAVPALPRLFDLLRSDLLRRLIPAFEARPIEAPRFALLHLLHLLLLANEIAVVKALWTRLVFASLALFVSLAAIAALLMLLRLLLLLVVVSSTVVVILRERWCSGCAGKKKCNDEFTHDSDFLYSLA
jgi:hypothetical protein